jgi:hypothetical protein
MKSQPQLWVRKYTDTQWNALQELGPAGIRPGETNDWVLLDLYPAEPIQMTLRVQNVMEPTVAASSYSQTFRIPNTQANGRFFQSAFNVNATYYDPSKKAQAYININGLFFSAGCVQLMNVYFNDNAQKVEYEITYFGDTSDFASQIGITNQGFLQNLDFSKYSHEKNYANIVKSWNAGPNSGLAGNASKPGDILYPLVEWGYTYEGSGANARPNIPTLSIGGVKSFTDPAFPLQQNQLKPCLRLKAIWDSIFETTEYTYSSTFLESEEFTRLYVVTDSVARATVDSGIFFKGVNAGGRIFGDRLRLDAPAIVDLAGNYDFNTQTFKVGVAGVYSFKFSAQYNFRFGAPDAASYVTFALKNLDGSTINSGINFFSDANPTEDPNGSIEVYSEVGFSFAAGTQFYFSIYPSIPYGSDILWDTITVESFEVPPNDQIDMKNYFAPNIKQIDFMRSVITQFKLVFIPDRERTKHFNIVPWKDWIQQGEVKDWSNKLNGKVDIKSTPLFQSQTRFTTYKTDEDADYLNFNFQQAYKQTFGQNNLDSGIEVIKGTTEIKSIFAAMPIAPIGYGTGATAGQVTKANTFLIPHIAKDTPSNDGPGKREPIQPKLRLAWYNQLVGITGPNSPQASTTWYLQNDYPGTGGIAQPQVPLLSSYFPNPWTDNAYLLDWRESPVFWDKGLTGNPQAFATSNNFNRYWSRWYDAAYGSGVVDQITGYTDFDYSTILECEFILNFQDIQKLNFNDLIFVKDAYYMINSIDFTLNGQLNSCKAQLFKVNNLGVYLPNENIPVPGLCYNGTSPCSARCCDANSQNVTVYTSNGNLEFNSRVYSNIAGNIYAPAGYYKQGGWIYEISDVGLIIQVFSVDYIDITYGCVCVPELFSKVLCYEPAEIDKCLACCCKGPTATVWVPDSTNWYNATTFYQNSTGTLLSSPGWYSDGTKFVKLDSASNNSQQGTCTCNCDIYDLYAFGCCYNASSKCTAVCCLADNAQYYYGNASTLATSTFLYKNTAKDPVDNGWYWNGTSVVQVTGGAGAITTVSDSTGCYPCAIALVPIYFNYTNSGGAVVGTFTLSYSFDLSTWVELQSFDLATLGTSYNYTGAVPPNTYAKSSYSYTPTGIPRTFTITNAVDGAVITTSNTNPKSFATASQSIAGETLFSYNLSLTATPYDCALSGGTATKCAPFTCIIDTNTTVVTDVTFCCDPVIVNEGDTLQILGATGTVNGNC